MRLLIIDQHSSSLTMTSFNIYFLVGVAQ